jgi:cytoskeletal protein CcmA (bactofilin family)
LKFKGDLTANEDLLIQGRVEGSIKHTSNLTIGEEGKVKANINAEFICVEGKVTGDLYGSKSVVVKATANIDGNIHSPTVSLLEGSTFNGKIDMSGKEQPQAETPKVSQEVTVAADKKDTAKTEVADRPATVTRKRSASAA